MRPSDGRTRGRMRPSIWRSWWRHAAKTRTLGAGTVIGTGTGIEQGALTAVRAPRWLIGGAGLFVHRGNPHDRDDPRWRTENAVHAAGRHCADRKCADHDNHSIFGAIEQEVVAVFLSRRQGAHQGALWPSSGLCALRLSNSLTK